MNPLPLASHAVAALCCAAVCSPAAAADLPLATAASAANDVCAFIAAAYDRGDQDKLWGYPDPVDIAGDGKLRHVYIIEQGTAHVHSIVASTAVLTPSQQQEANSEVDFYGSIGQDMELETLPRIFAFRGVYYVVYEGDGGPYDVVKPDSGELCRFKRHYSAVLGENHAPALCDQARAGKAFAKLPTRNLAAVTVEDAATLDLPGPFSPVIARYAQAKLDPAAAMLKLGYFTYDSSAGAGCQAAGVVILNGREIEQSARNEALLAAQQDMTNCHGSNAFAIRAGGANLIEIDGGWAEQQTAPPRVLLRLSGDKVEDVCRVEQRATYTPAPAGRAP